MKGAQKNKLIQSGKPTNSERSLFLLLYSVKFPWGLKTHYCQIDFKRLHCYLSNLKKNRRKPYNDNLCLFRALYCIKKCGFEEETSKLLTLLQEKNRGTNLVNFQCVLMNDNPIREDLVQVSIFLYDTDFTDGAMTGNFVKKVLGNIPTLFAY